MLRRQLRDVEAPGKRRLGLFVEHKVEGPAGCIAQQVRAQAPVERGEAAFMPEDVARQTEGVTELVRGALADCGV